MNKAHKIVSDFIIDYLNTHNLDKLTEVLAESAPLARGEKYVLNIEQQIAEIESNVEIAVWYLAEFFDNYCEESPYNIIFIGRYDYGEEFEYTVFKIDNHYIKCIYNSELSDLILVKPVIDTYGKIDINWFNSQLINNFHSDVSEVLQEIKSKIIPLETKQNWLNIESTL